MRRLQQAALLFVFSMVISGLFAMPTSAAINPQISFQGKLTNTDGTNVTDGSYSIRFRIYTDPTADTGACASTCKWEETQGTVSVASGLFNVMLGSSTTLPGSVDFNASALYLGVKVGSDAEMTPRIRLGAVPQAFNSDTLDGIDSAAFGQLATGQTWTGANVMQPTTNITGLTVKQTSTGSPTADIFNVQTANSTAVIQVTGPAANEAAVTIASVGATRNLTLNSGSGTIVLGASTLSRTAAGTTTINLVDSSNTLLSVTNTGAGSASINVDGGYQVGGTPGSSVTCAGGQFLQNQVVNGGITTGGTCAAAAGASSNSFTTIDTPAGTDPTADTATDTMQLLATGTNLTITGANDPETITFDVIESVLAGNGLVVNSDALDISTGNGLQLSGDAVRVNQDFAFTWTADHTYNLQGTENVDVTSDLAGTVNMLGLVGTPSASAGTTRGLFIQQASSANTNGLDSGIVIDNADADLALATAIEITNTGAFATGITKGIDFNTTGIVTDIELQNAEQIDNNTDDNVVFTGTGGTNNETFTIDLDSNTSSGATLSSGGAFVLINDNLSVGIDGNTTENISYGGFTFSGNDFYVDDMLGVNGNAFLDGTLSVLGAATFDGLTTFNTDVDLTLAGTENIAVTHDLAGTVNVLSIIGTPSASAGTAQGLFIQQANSANGNGFDAGAVIDNADTDLAVADGILVLSTGFNNGIVDAIDVSAANIQNGINLGSNNIILNGDTINDFTGNGLTVSGSALTVQAAASADALSATTSSGSGLETLASGIAMLQGCADAQILKWNETTDVWACAADGGATTPDFDAIYAQSITNTNLNMEVDNAGGLTFDLTTTGDFAIRDNTTAFATFSNTGAITFAPTAGQNFTVNQAAGTNTNIVATAAPTTDQVVITNAGQASATTGVDGLQVTFGTSNASGDAIHITPSFAGGATDALTYNGLEIDGFSPTNAAGTDTVNGIKIGNLTDPGATITSAALTIGTGWDSGIVVGSGSILTSNLGIEFTDSDTNPTCGAGNYSIFADLSETKLKKCVNGTVSDLGAGDKYETITATGACTYTKPSDAILVIVQAVGAGGGGGGGSSNTGAVVRTGGSGGGGGAYNTRSFLASNLGSSENCSVGTGGTAGTAGASGGSGGDGGIGGSTTFGTTTMLFAGGGGGGRLGGNSAVVGGGGGGGGTGASGTTGTTAVGTGGGPGPNVTSVSGGSGGNGSITATAGVPAEYGGGGGGGHTNVPANSNGGTSVYGGGGGGVGGGATITPATVNATAGGNTNTFVLAGGGGGAAGSSGAAPTAGTAGAAGTSTKSGTGGGGGGGTVTANTAGAAGGAGGAVGGGGGGGGVGSNTQVGGAGGVGGRGELRIWSIRGSGADLAELYGTHDASIEPGDVVCLDSSMRAGVKKCANKYDSGAMGIITTNPGLVIGDVEDPDAKAAPVVLAGRTPVKVSTENGPIATGDLLTPSSKPGVAMKATKAGQIIGQAMGPFSGDGVGMTVVFVKTNFSHGTNVSGIDPSHAKETLAYLAQEQQTIQTEPSDLSEIFTDRVVAGLGVVTPEVTANKVATDALEAASGDDIQIKLTENGRLVASGPNGKEAFSFDSKGNTTMALDLNVGGSIAVGGDATFKGNAFFYKLVTFTEKTVFKNDLSLGGHLGTVGVPLTATTETAAGITKAPEGSSNAILASTTLAGNDISGQFVLTAGDQAMAGKVLTVKFNKAYDNPPKVLLTAASESAAQTPYYVQSTKDGFSLVFINTPIPGTNFHYNYWVVD